MSDAIEARIRWEEIETRILAPAARFSREATRPVPEPKSDLRTEYQRDRDRITHSKSFRRLKHKTQVFIAPAGDHYRTRLTHTLEVTQVARTIGRALRLNEDLIEAIGLGHDLGHTPFGHAGETALASLIPGFRHNEQSLRLVDRLERNGQGLNLTNDTRDGILHHSKPHHEITGAHRARANSLEGEVIRISDGIAYINHDLDDALRAGLVRAEDVPPVVFSVLGDTHAARIDRLVRDVVLNSQAESVPGNIGMSDEVREAANALRRFLFERVYDPLNQQPDTIRAQHLVQALCNHYLEHPGEMPAEYGPTDGDPPERCVADWVASMTDRYAVETYQRLFVPRYWSGPAGA